MHSTASVLEIPYRFTGKERDTETGLYYYGARYLDSKTGRWLSTDPALGEYVPGAPVNDEARKRNGNLPGQGGVFNTVNLHLYHYAGNNPLKYTDPNGRADRYYIEINAGSATFVMGNSGKFSINYSDKINVSVSYTDKNKISVILPPNSTISILANSGSGKLTIANPNTSARAIDLGYSIDAYEKYQVNIGNNINVLQNLIKKDVDSAWESLSDFTASYFFGVLSYAVGLDPASIIGEGLAADPKPIDNLINIYNSMKTANKRALESNLQDIAYKRRIWINLE